MDFNESPDFIAEVRKMRTRIEAIEASIGTRRYTTANRPNPATVQGLVIFNTTTLKHEGSDGTSWVPMY